ncbi:MAG: hypothetical protein ACP5IX_01890 [Patescibacteria group bacterium]
MLINLILLIILVVCLGGIIYILMSKFFLLASIDVSQIRQEQFKAKKRILIEQRIRRGLTIIRQRIKNIITKLLIRLKVFFKKTPPGSSQPS